MQDRTEQLRREIAGLEHRLRKTRALVAMFGSEAWCGGILLKIEHELRGLDAMLDDTSNSAEALKVTAAKRSVWRHIQRWEEEADDQVEDLEHAIASKKAALENLER